MPIKDWLQDWQDTEKYISIDSLHDGIHIVYLTYSIYKKDFSEGSVLLGPPNGLHYDGNMYFVLVKERTQLSPLRNSPFFEAFVKPFKVFLS